MEGRSVPSLLDGAKILDRTFLSDVLLLLCPLTEGAIYQRGRSDVLMEEERIVDIESDLLRWKE